MTNATILIPQFRGMFSVMFRASFGSVKELAIASDASEKTVERWWRGETCPNAAQLLLVMLNSDPFSAQMQALHDDLKTRRTEINARLERLRVSRLRANVGSDRNCVDGYCRLGGGNSGMGSGQVRSVGRVRRA